LAKLRAVLLIKTARSLAKTKKKEKKNARNLQVRVKEHCDVNKQSQPAKPKGDQKIHFSSPIKVGIRLPFAARMKLTEKTHEKTEHFHKMEIHII